MATASRIRVKKQCQKAVPTEDNIVLKCSLDKCRVCLRPGEIPIFGEIDFSSEVAEFGGVEVSEEDKFPKYICEACYTLLEAAILFRKTAQKSNEILMRVGDYLQNTDTAFIKVEQDSGISQVVHELQETRGLENDEYLIEVKPMLHDDSISNVDPMFIYDSMNADDVSSDGSNNSSDEDHNLDKEYVTIDSTDDENDDDTKEKDDNGTLLIVVSDKSKVEKELEVLSKKPRCEFNCKVCNVPFKSAKDCEIHYLINHKTKVNVSKITCEVCQNVVSRKYYKVHMKLHRQTYKETAKKKEYHKIECKICHKVLSQSYYKFHMKMHGSETEKAERQKECPICNKYFSVNYYSDHMKRVHDEVDKYKMDPSEKTSSIKKPKLIQCLICDKKIKKAKYKLHLAAHGGNIKRYVCDKCGRVFKHPSAFKTHCLTHGSELKYKCQFCPYRGLHQGLLKVHVRTHTGDYNYKCDECPARFITKSNLTQHKLRHRFPTDIKCSDCGRAFYTKRALERHYNTIHLKMKDVLCDICGKGFSHRDGMLSHQLKVHNRQRLTDRRGRMPSYLKAEKENNIKSED